MEENEQINSGVETAESPEPQDTSAEAPSEAAAKPAPEGKQETDSENVPFHQHPRFKELVDQKNAASEQVKAMEQRYAAMENQLRELSKPKTQTQQDALIERLKGIDPEFGERIEKLDSSTREIEALKATVANFQQQQTRTAAYNQINELHEQNKVPAELRDMIQSQIELASMRNPQLGLHDLPRVYKEIHSSMNKTIEAIKRADRESYVKGKKADATAPAQAKGKAVSPSKEGEYSKDPEVARSQLVARILKNSRASNTV